MWTTMGSVMISLMLASSASSKEPARSAQQSTSFIVHCDCDTPAKRLRIRDKVGRAGGKILYLYEQLGGLAVTFPADRNPAVVERTLLKIPGVFAVQPDRTVQLGEPGGPQ